MPGDALVSLTVDDRIAVVRLERPEAMNAISGDLADELAEVCWRVSHDDDVWVMVLTGAGDRAFCVGADLKERASFEIYDFYQNREQVRAMFSSLRKVPQPTIAAVFGYALGGGFELALSCDIVIAAQGTEFGLPEARVGLIPAGGGTQLLTRKLGVARAKDFIFRGRRFDAAHAWELGLVSEIAPPEDLMSHALEVARDVCRSSPVAVREAKRAIDASLGIPLEDGLNIENDAWRIVINTEDRAEGIRAFNAKRDPNWQNK